MEKLKQLREQTGAGITDCKKALDEANGDLEVAVEILRKKGISKAAKRTDREANEGVIKFSLNSDNSKGYIVEVNSETDFVARNEKFQEFAEAVLKVIEDKEPQDLNALMESAFNDSTVKEELESLSGVIGEKLDIKNFAIVKGDSVAGYLHMGKLGILVALDKPEKSDLAYDIAMHIAASNPLCITPEEVPSNKVEKEKEIYREQLEKEGKPAEIIEKIMMGKVNKYFEEVCLNKQDYIKDEKQKVEQVLGDAKVLKFVRFSLS
ncbi:MAG: translation elongation factor Ts [Candidatus Pacebacteria bacterium]|nr:translation elongation factor Ts [Candidatus Paceibacterota bacterium]